MDEFMQLFLALDPETRRVCGDESFEEPDFEERDECENWDCDEDYGNDWL